jgi:hypothetical protein
VMSTNRCMETHPDHGLHRKGSTEPSHSRRGASHGLSGDLQRGHWRRVRR